MKGVIPHIVLAIPLALIHLSCSKDQGKNTALALSDRALHDSCVVAARYWYMQDSNTVYPGTAGPHGSYRLRFNAIAFAALRDQGKLPLNAMMPSGSLVVKGISKGSANEGFAFMYKKDNSWIWGESRPDGSTVFSVNKNPGICISCHSQPANRDLILTFKYH